jgi:hypothetical protein
MEQGTAVPRERVVTHGDGGAPLPQAPRRDDEEKASGWSVSQRKLVAESLRRCPEAPRG